MAYNVEREWANRKKIITAAIRVKYSVLADNELIELLPAERKKFDRHVQNGTLPDGLDLCKLLEIDDATA